MTWSFEDRLGALSAHLTHRWVLYSEFGPFTDEVSATVSTLTFQLPIIGGSGAGFSFLIMVTDPENEELPLQITVSVPVLSGVSIGEASILAEGLGIIAEVCGRADALFF